MAITGFICHDDYLAKTAKLTDEEVGRLFRALMHYHITGEIVEPEGRESIAFDFIREDIDRAERAYQEKCETNRRNRMSAIDNERKRPSTNVNDRQRTLPIEDNRIIKVTEENIKTIPFIDDDKATEVNADQNRVLDAAEDAGFLKSNSVRAKLIALYAENGLDKMLAAIDSCVHHGVINLAYLEACLKGEPKKEKSGQKLPAQEYHQRDYKDAQEEAFERMMALGG